MFKLSKDEELTNVLMMQLLDTHRKEITDIYEPLYKAYISEHKILEAEAKPAHKPDNRIVVNFPKYIVDTMNGFFAGNPIKVTADDENVAEYVEYLDQYNDQDDNNAELSKIMSLYGKGYEMYFTDEESEQCITYLTPIEAFMVFDDTVQERPLYFVRRYKDRHGNEYGCIYRKEDMRHFKTTGGFQWTDEDWRPHYYDDVPATEFIENGDKQSLITPIMSIVNAYNKAISEKSNDVDYFADAYMKVLGTALDEEDIKHIRSNRVINFEGDDASKITVEFMSKPESDTTQENLLNRLERLIFQISMVANISDENFGTSSGIALKYKLQAMMNQFKNKERKFTSGMNRRYKLLFSHPASRVPADAWVQLHYHFTPNIPANLMEEADIAARMEGVVSKETQLKVLSIVDNVQAEIEKIEEENAAAEQTIVDEMMFAAQQQAAVTEENTVADEGVE